MLKFFTSPHFRKVFTTHTKYILVAKRNVWKEPKERITAEQRKRDKEHIEEQFKDSATAEEIELLKRLNEEYERALEERRKEEENSSFNKHRSVVENYKRAFRQDIEEKHSYQYLDMISKTEADKQRITLDESFAKQYPELDIRTREITKILQQHQYDLAFKKYAPGAYGVDPEVEKMEEDKRLEQEMNERKNIFNALEREQPVRPIRKLEPYDYVAFEKDNESKSRKKINIIFEMLNLSEKNQSQKKETHSDDPELLDQRLNVPSEFPKPKVKLDPGFAWLAELERLPQGEDERHVWNKKLTRKLYSLIDGGYVNYRSIEDFYEKIKWAGGREEVMDKLKAIFPTLEESEVEILLDRILHQLRSYQKPTSNMLNHALMRVTDSITADAKPEILRWADVLASPPTKLLMVERALKTLARGKATGYQLYKMCRIATSVNFYDYKDETSYLHHVLSPIFRREKPIVDPHANINPFHPIIKYGTSYGLGRRKTAIAQAWVTPGSGRFDINGMGHLEYFKNHIDIFKIAHPLKVSGAFGQFDVKVKVRGGGTSGQADAIALAVARALSRFVPGIGRFFRKRKMLTRDPRVVEEKKPGQPKARKKFQWVKR